MNHSRSSALGPAPFLADLPLCLHCLEPNNPWSQFCGKCYAPISSHATTGPMESIAAEGYAMRAAAERPSRFIVVAGVWILCLPMAAAGIVLMMPDRFPGILNTLRGIGSFAIAVALIARTTRNYLVRPRTAS